jgi:hypothetical protein
MKLSILWKPALAVMGLCLIAVPARADRLYTFVKFTCNPKAQSTKVVFFHEWNQVAVDRIERDEEDTYDLNEIGAREHRKILVCDMGPGQEVALKAVKGDVPKYDDVALLINGRRTGFFNLDYEQSVDIQMLKPNEFKLHECQLSSHKEEEPAKNIETQCGDEVINTNSTETSK